MSDKSLISYLKNQYKIKKINSLKEIPHNNLNSKNYLVMSVPNSYVLHNFHQKQHSKKLESICKIVDRCINNGAKCSKPIKNIDGNYVDIRNRFFLTQFYAGNLFDGTINEITDLAKNLAILHKYLNHNQTPFRFKSSYDKFHQNLLTQDDLIQITNIIKEKQSVNQYDKLFLNHYDYFVHCFTNHPIEYQNLPAINFHKQLIHNDVQPGNVIFHYNKVHAFIDFEGMEFSPLLQDISFACFRFATFGNNNQKIINQKMKIFIKTYLQFNPIDTDHLFYLDHFLLWKILSGIGKIFSQYYFFNSSIWLTDLSKYMALLQLFNKKFPSLSKSKFM